jgi:protease-4
VAVRRGVWLVLSFIAVALVLSVLGIAAFSYFLLPRGPLVPDNATLVLRLQGELAETEATSLYDQLLTSRTTVRGIVDALRAAKGDARIKQLLVVPGGQSPFWAKNQEVRDAILDFRLSGKKTAAFLEYGGDQEYYLATACERVYMLPTSTLDLRGVATYEVFLRGTLDKIGVYPDLVHIGDFKTAVNTFTEKTYTPAHREMAESLNGDAFDQLVQGIAQGRKKNVDEVRMMIDEGPFLPEDALRLGFVDDLAYRDEVPAKAGFTTGAQETKAEDYQRQIVRGSGRWRADKVAVIYATGTIASGKSGEGPDGTYAGSDTLVEYIHQAREDATVKAIVLRIDSPGGSTIASDVIWRELMLARAKKPLVVSMSDLAASGGYYIAMPAHTIIAEPGTLTGSIGIFGGKFVTGGTFKKLGANVEGVSKGKFADINSPARPYSKDERAKMEEQLQAFYDQFIEKVATSRKSTPEKIDAIAQGRVWTGRQARELGLVDELGGLGAAVRVARQHAKIPVDRDVDLVIYPPRRSLYELLFEGMNQSNTSDSSGGAGLTTAAFLRMMNPAERRVMADLTAPFRLLRRGEPLALMPYVFVH